MIRGHCLVGSLTGVVASKSVTEASKGALGSIGNRPQRLYVYGLDNLFKPVAGAQLSATQPTLFGKGGLWVDTVKKQLWFSADGGIFNVS